MLILGRLVRIVDARRGEVWSVARASPAVLCRGRQTCSTRPSTAPACPSPRALLGLLPSHTGTATVVWFPPVRLQQLRSCHLRPPGVENKMMRDFLGTPGRVAGRWGKQLLADPLSGICGQGNLALGNQRERPRPSGGSRVYHQGLGLMICQRTNVRRGGPRKQLGATQSLNNVN